MPCRYFLILSLISCVFALGFVSRVRASGISINEFSVEPVTTQWVELYNGGSSSVDISGWVLDDEGSVSTKYTISSGTVMVPGVCLVFSSGNFSFNKSSADGAKLLSGDTVLDTYSYAKSPGEGISFSRLPDGSGTWATASASPGSFNSTGDPCVPPATPTATPSLAHTPTPTITQPPTSTPVPAVTATPARVVPTQTPRVTGVIRPTKQRVSDILGIQDVASKGAGAVGAEDMRDDGLATPPPGTLARPVVFSLLFVGTGTGLLATALALQKTDVWKMHLNRKKEHG